MARGVGSTLTNQYLRDFKGGSLQSYHGPSNPTTPVTDVDQAIAIALREQEEEQRNVRLRRQGMTVPNRRYSKPSTGGGGGW